VGPGDATSVGVSVDPSRGSATDAPDTGGT
jgi:hypothetical protein